MTAAAVDECAIFYGTSVTAFLSYDGPCWLVGGGGAAAMFINKQFMELRTALRKLYGCCGE